MKLFALLISAVVVPHYTSAVGPSPAPSWQCGDERRLVEILTEHNASPMGEVYDDAANAERSAFFHSYYTGDSSYNKNGEVKDKLKRKLQAMGGVESLREYLADGDIVKQLQTAISSYTSDEGDRSPSPHHSHGGDRSLMLTDGPSVVAILVLILIVLFELFSDEEKLLCDRLGKETTELVCCGYDYDHSPKVRRTQSIKPWTSPDYSSAELIDNDPGIWKIDNFVDEDTVTKMLNIFENDDRFGPCPGSFYKDLECKQCFSLSSSNSINEEEGEIVNALLSKVKHIWQTDSPRDYFFVQRVQPNCHPTHIHVDSEDGKSATTSFNFYLNDSDAGVIFPNANLIVKPKRGMALTWLNVHPDGGRNYMSDHGIQAMPKNGSVRYVLSYRSFMSDEEMLNLQVQ